MDQKGRGGGVINGWRKLRNENLRNLCPSPDIIRVVKSRRTLSTGYEALMRETRNAFILVGKPKRRKYLRDLYAKRRIILNWTLKK
jgi:hypothetical protein